MFVCLYVCRRVYPVRSFSDTIWFTLSPPVGEMAYWLVTFSVPKCHISTFTIQPTLHAYWVLVENVVGFHIHLNK